MPTSRVKYHPAQRISHALLLCVLLASCSSSADGTGSSGPSLSPTARYDLTIYGCGRTSLCNGTYSPTTSAQLAALSKALRADARAGHVAYRSEAANYQAARRTLPSSQRQYLKPGDLPLSLLVSARSPADVATMIKSYKTFAGVSVVRRCLEGVKCQFGTLRADQVLK